MSGEPFFNPFPMTFNQFLGHEKAISNSSSRQFDVTKELFKGQQKMLAKCSPLRKKISGIENIDWRTLWPILALNSIFVTSNDVTKMPTVFSRHVK